MDIFTITVVEERCDFSGNQRIDSCKDSYNQIDVN